MAYQRTTSQGPEAKVLSPKARDGDSDAGGSVKAIRRPYSAPELGLQDTGQAAPAPRRPRAAIRRTTGRSPTNRAVSTVAQNVAQTLK
jgi:hypothetical protein